MSAYLDPHRRVQQSQLYESPTLESNLMVQRRVQGNCYRDLYRDVSRSAIHLDSYLSQIGATYNCVRCQHDSCRVKLNISSRVSSTLAFVSVVTSSYIFLAPSSSSSHSCHPERICRTCSSARAPQNFPRDLSRYGLPLSLTGQSVHRPGGSQTSLKDQCDTH